MLVKIGKGPTALMILEGVNGDEYTWVSADGVYLVLKEGKICVDRSNGKDVKPFPTDYREWKMMD